MSAMIVFADEINSDFAFRGGLVFYQGTFS